MGYVGVDELARVLRLRSPTEAQGTAMQRVIDTATAEVNSEIGTAWATADLASFPFAGSTDPDTGAYVDVPSPLAAALVTEVTLERAVEHWQQQESPFGVIGLGESVPTVTAKDTWDRHANKLVPLKRSWGVS
jgi:hypothetical protein